MGLPKKLTEKQILFADLIVENEGKMTAKDCNAIQAGYGEDSAHVTASNLQNENKYPLVVGRINELRLEKEKGLPELTSKQSQVW